MVVLLHRRQAFDSPSMGWAPDLGRMVSGTTRIFLGAFTSISMPILFSLGLFVPSSPGSAVTEENDNIASYCYDVSVQTLVSYDTPNIAAKKAAYMNSKGLAGGTFTSVALAIIRIYPILQEVIGSYLVTRQGPTLSLGVWLKDSAASILLRITSTIPDLNGITSAMAWMALLSRPLLRPTLPRPRLLVVPKV